MFCKHQWEEQPRQFGYKMHSSGNFTFDIPEKKLLNPYVTLITFKCIKCEKYKQKMLQGHIKDSASIPKIFRDSFDKIQ